MVHRRTYLALLVGGATGILSGTRKGTTQSRSETRTGAARAAQTATPTEQTKLAATDGDSDDQFGWSVAVDGGTILVGARDDEDPNGNEAGSAYVFERVEGAWRHQAKLTADDGDDHDAFGKSVAIDGSTAVVGAYHDEDPNGQVAGSAYVFERVEGAWRQQAKLTAADGDRHDGFGDSVAVVGSTALIGAPYDEDPNGDAAGSAYVFEQMNGTWTQQAKLTAADGDNYDRFGKSVALDRSTAVVGATDDEDPNGEDAGSAYVFEQTDGEWTQQAKLTADDGGRFDFFGRSVAVEESTVLIGTREAGHLTGSMYVFERVEGAWRHQAKLTADDGDNHDEFGESVAIDGSTAIVGARRDEDPNGQAAGSAYVFERVEGAWRQQAKVTAADGDNGDYFGVSVAVDGSTAVVGAYHDEDPNGEEAGSAYVFDLGATHPVTGRVVDLDGNGINDATVFAIDTAVTDEPFSRSFDDYTSDEDRPDLSPATTVTETRDGTTGQFRFNATDLPSTPGYVATWTSEEGTTWVSSVSDTPDQLQLTHELVFGPELATVDEWVGGTNRYDIYGGCLSVWRTVDPATPTNQTFNIALTQAMFGLVTAPATPTRAIHPWEISLDRTEGQYNDWQLNSQPLYPSNAVFSLIVPEEVADDDVTVAYSDVTVAESASKMLAEGSDIDRERLTLWHPTRTPHVPAAVAPAVTRGYESVSPAAARSRFEEHKQIADTFGSVFSLFTGAIPYVGTAVSFLDTVFTAIESGSSDVTPAARLGSAIESDINPDLNQEDIVERQYWMAPRVPPASVVYRVPVTFPDVEQTAEFTAECTWAATDANPASVEPSHLCVFREQFTAGPAPQFASGSNDDSSSQSPPADVTDDGRVATDPDSDGLYEDVNGDDDVTPGDATVLFNAIFEGTPAVTENIAAFDFNDDGDLTPGDATVLFEEAF